MQMKNNAVGWFEVPVSDMERAIKFYETVFGFSLQRQKMGDVDMAWFPWIESGMGAAGSLVYHPDFYKPSEKGIRIYFTAYSGDLKNELSRVETAGGKIIQEKTLITKEYGYMATIMDTENNIIALHSMN